MIYFVHSRAHAIPLFIDANVLPLAFLYYESVSNLMHHVNNNSNTPLNILNFFQKLSVVHSYNTRSSTSGKFHFQSSRLEIQKRSFSRFGVKLWNQIPQRVKASLTKGYKREIRGIRLFQILINENNYIETSAIVKKSRISQIVQIFFLFFSFSFIPMYWCLLLFVYSVSSVVCLYILLLVSFFHFSFLFLTHP